MFETFRSLLRFFNYRIWSLVKVETTVFCNIVSVGNMQEGLYVLKNYGNKKLTHDVAAIFVHRDGLNKTTIIIRSRALRKFLTSTRATLAFARFSWIDDPICFL